jgi:hypothetical protein
MRNTSLSTAALLALALLPSAAGAAEPYEGAWVRSAKECSNKDGPTSLTVIDLKVNVDGKPRPMVETSTTALLPASPRRETTRR